MSRKLHVICSCLNMTIKVLMCEMETVGEKMCDMRATVQDCNAKNKWQHQLLLRQYTKLHLFMFKWQSFPGAVGIMNLAKGCPNSKCEIYSLYRALTNSHKYPKSWCTAQYRVNYWVCIIEWVMNEWMNEGVISDTGYDRQSTLTMTMIIP